MSRTFGQWFRILVTCMAVGVLFSTVYSLSGAAREGARSEVRRAVDFTVLPIVLPDGSESLPPTDADAIEGETTLPPEPASSQQAAVPTSEPAPIPGPAPEPEPAPVPVPESAPAPAPKPAPVAAEPGTVKRIGLAERQGGFTLTVRADRAVGDTSYLNLDNPRRLVIDLRDKWKLATRNVIRSKGAVKHVVVGEHPDRLRLVIHFNKAPKSRIIPLFTRAGTTLKVTVAYP